MNFEDFDASVPDDAELMKMPHPLRVPAVQKEYVEVLRKILKPAQWEHLVTLMRDNSLMTSDVVTQVIDLPGFEPFRHIVRMSAQLPGGSEVGNLYANMLCLRHVVAPQPFFRIDDQLCELLEHTDLDEELPVDVLKVPYPRFYVEFGRLRELKLFVPNDLSGNHILEGAYVEHGTRDEEGRGLYVLLTASPIGKRNALDDATHAIFMPLEREMSLTEAIRWSFEKGNENARKHGLIQAPAETIQPAIDCVNYLAKVLLYISMPEARRSVHPDRTQWLKSTSALKSVGKKAKAERKAARLVDYILITAPPPPPETVAGSGDSGRGSVRVHWRRGHYRMQAHGPQHSLRKLTFIRPLLVNAAQGIPVAPTQNYKVT